jgi:membrane-associated phospholipid phosphatase
MPVASSTEAGILRRLASQWRMKLLLSAVLFSAFGAPYYLLQRFPLLTPGRFRLTAIDRRVGFHPWWIWVYESAYLLIPIAPLLSRGRRELRMYARGFLLMTGVAVAFYVLLPIEAPRPADVPRNGLWGFLLSYDKTINTFPSLHVALVVHSLMFGAWLIGRSWTRANTLAMGAGVVWAALICYSTLATKQHYAVDVPGGILLGWAGQWLASGARGAAPADACLEMRIS